METHLILLEIAKNDLEAAKCLYDKKLYSQAIFFFQQSVEKAVKSFGIAFKIINETEAKDIGHKSVKFYLNFF